MQRLLKRVYEAIMIILVMITIITLWTEDTYNSMVNLVVWFVFVIDFFLRLLTAKEKWGFVKKNPFLVIAIIPFDQFFQVARIVRVFYLFRIKTITKYYFLPYVKKLNYFSTTLVLFVICSLVVIESLVILKIEHAINSYYDAFYVVIGHFLFFGHHLFEIEKIFTIWVLTINSMVGILIQGLALQWAFSKFEPFLSKFNKKSD